MFSFAGESSTLNKTERMEMSEDSIDTVRIDQGVGKKTVSDSLKIGYSGTLQ